MGSPPYSRKGADCLTSFIRETKEGQGETPRPPVVWSVAVWWNLTYILYSLLAETVYGSQENSLMNVQKKHFTEIVISDKN
jgi:hypothetical protein